MSSKDIEAKKETLTREIKNKKVCVIGGVGSIDSSFIKAVLCIEPKSVLNENRLAELVRDKRSTYGLYVPDEFLCYTLNFADSILNASSVRKRALTYSQLLHSQGCPK